MVSDVLNSVLVRFATVSVTLTVTEHFIRNTNLIEPRSVFTDSCRKDSSDASYYQGKSGCWVKPDTYNSVSPSELSFDQFSLVIKDRIPTPPLSSSVMNSLFEGSC